MIKRSLSIILIALVFTSCNSSKKESVLNENSKDSITQKETANEYNTKGYELMQQKCFICHIEKPDPSKKDLMIAPPMLRVQEHYKPSYPNKNEFVQIITEWVKNPSESNTLMPGAVRKFKLMPKLPYEDEDLKLIIETLYDIDFGEMPKMRMNKNNGLQLNNGNKWKINQNTVSQINSITDQIEQFQSDDIVSYNKLGRDVFDNAKTILLDESYTGELFDQLHNFFNDVEGNIHLLISTNSIDDAKKHQDVLKIKFNEFNNYFENK
ncbi:MAG: hypothetical protein KAH67_06940 [Flavobacteriaceae bacterium]|nr:hypothetical protein [Flavobacteriaceae bacterium]